MASPKDFFAADVRNVRRELKALGGVDLVVGIPSYQEADSIAHVVRQCDAGIQEYFGHAKGVIINVDNDSPDGTQEAFLNAGSRTPLVYISTPRGAVGKGNNFWNLFHAARLVQARAIVAVDADLVSITPQWVRNLAQPILASGVDYITPLYARNEYDGTITNNICYPVIYGVLGSNLRQPIGGDFGLSTTFSNSLLNGRWLDTTRDYGIDIFLTSSALLGGYVVAQTHLGSKVHKPSAPKLGPMFTQVVTTLFSQLTSRGKEWIEAGSVTNPPTFDGIPTGEPQSLAVDYKAIKRTVLHQYWTERQTLQQCLSPGVFSKIDGMMRRGAMAVGADLWCHAVYDLLASFAVRRGKAREAVVEALKPLFFARVASFYRDTLDLDHKQSEAKILGQAKVFRRRRSYLADRLGDGG